MKAPHKHAEVIKAWAEGATIEFRHHKTHNWAVNYGSPNWYTDTEYRIAPEVRLPDLPESIVFSSTRVQLACREYGGQCYEAGYKAAKE